MHYFLLNCFLYYMLSHSVYRLGKPVTLCLSPPPQASPADAPLKVSIAVTGSYSDVAHILISAKLALLDSADYPLPNGSTDYSGSGSCSCVGSTSGQESDKEVLTVQGAADLSPIVPVSPIVAPPPCEQVQSTLYLCLASSPGSPLRASKYCG